MAEPKEPREPRIPKESPPFVDNKWTRTWIMYFESLFTLSVKEAVRQTLEVAVTHSGELTKDLPVFGADAAVIKVGTKSGNTNKVVTNTGTNVTGNTVKWDANGNLIDAGVTPGGGGGGGSGTVTSVALTVPAEFSVSGSPVTTSGTLAVSKATQSANTVYAGPTTGSAAAPTFRTVVPADLPLASSSAFGAVKVDGTTITAASGVISAVGGGGGSGALVLLGTYTASSSSQLAIVSRNASGQSGAIFQTDYDEYQIEINYLVPATTMTNLYYQVSSNGGSSYDSATHYQTSLFSHYNNSTSPFVTNSNLAAQGVLSEQEDSNSQWGHCGSLKVRGVLSTSKVFLILGETFRFDSSNNQVKISVMTNNTTLASVNAMRIYYSSGNITSGNVRVYGIAM